MSKSVYDVVEETLHLSKTIHPIDGGREFFHQNEIIEWLPPGWHVLVHRMFDFLSVYPGGIVGVWVSRGRLILNGVDFKYPQHNFVNRVAHTIAGDSASICMISGQAGIRRKSVRGWPCLSHHAYISYLNEAPSQDLPNGI